MSVVAVKNYKDKIVIGADSFVGIAWGMQKKEKMAKLACVNKNIVIGTVGYTKDHFLLKTFASAVQLKNNTEDGVLDYMGQYHKWVKDKMNQLDVKIDDSHHILIFKNKVYEFNNYDIFEIKEGEGRAIGAGLYFAQTALHLGKTVKEGIEVACELSIYCEKPVNIIEIKK